MIRLSCTISAAICGAFFGLWQQNWWAGAWMFWVFNVAVYSAYVAIKGQKEKQE